MRDRKTPVALAAGVSFLSLAALPGCGRDRAVEAPVVVIVGVPEPPRPDAGGPGPYVYAEGPVPRPTNDAFLGHWEGVGTQNDGFSWPMKVDLTSTGPGSCARVEYPSIPCSAVWICTRFEGGVLEAREELSADSARRCVDLGTMKMRLVQDGALDWQWAGSGMTASSTLRKNR